MEFPDRDVALAWVGRTLIDRDGAEIGACTAVFSDDATGLTEWVCSELDGPAVFIPAVGAAEAGGQVRVAVSRAEVASAPSVGGAQHISEEEEAALYRHYGFPHSRDGSPTLLPTEESQPPTDGVASDAASDDVLQTPTAAEPAAAEPGSAEPTPEPAAAEPVAAELASTPTAAEPVAEPVAGQDAAPRTESASEAGQDQPGTKAPSTRGARRVAPVVGGLAGVALALGVALRVRRLRTRRPPTRRERLAQRGRAASATLGARTGQIAASAAPLLQSTRQVVRRRGRAGAVAGGIPAAAVLTLTALRRRRSATSRTTDEDRRQSVVQALPVPAADRAATRRPAAPQPPPSTP